jgi:AcrR family transcriptional regulator
MKDYTKIWSDRLDTMDSKKRKRAKQQHKIVSAAGRLFWRKGYLGTSIDDIAKAANVNKASIYYYFKDKSFLLYEVILTPLQMMIDQALPNADSDSSSQEKLEVLIKNHIRWQAEHPGLAGIGHVERKNLPPTIRREYIGMRDRYECIIRRTIEEGIRKGEFRFADAKLATLLTLGLVNSIIQWYKPKGSLSADEIASEAFVYISRALQAQ